MTPRRATSPRDQQLLVRLTAEYYDVLTAVAHLERVTPNAYAYRVLAGHLERLTDEPHVRSDLDNRREYAEARATVEALPTAPRRKPKADKRPPTGVQASDPLSPSAGGVDST